MLRIERRWRERQEANRVLQPRREESSSTTKVLLDRRPWERARRWRLEEGLLLGRLLEEILVDREEEGWTRKNGSLLVEKVLQTWAEEVPSRAAAAAGAGREDAREVLKGTAAPDSDQVREVLLLLRVDWEVLSWRRP